MNSKVILFGLLTMTGVFSSQSVFASGGIDNERRIECKGDNHLIVMKLGDAYSSELQGSALVYNDAGQLGRMMTSMDSCLENRGLTHDTPVATPAGATPVVVCGNIDAKKSQGGKTLAMEGNAKGYRVLYWVQGDKAFARLEKLSGSTASNVFGSDLACQ